MYEMRLHNLRDNSQSFILQLRFISSFKIRVYFIVLLLIKLLLSVKTLQAKCLGSARGLTNGPDSSVMLLSGVP